METQEFSNKSQKNLLKSESLASILGFGAKKIAIKSFYFLARVFLAFVFIYASINKISDPIEFSNSLANYKLFPYYINNLIAITLPWIELFCGTLLLFGHNEKESSIILFSLLSIFTIIVLISMFRGLDFECGCFGTGRSDKIGLKKILENLILLILSLFLIAKEKIKLAKESEDNSLL